MAGKPSPYFYIWRPSHLSHLAVHNTVGLRLLHCNTFKVFSWYLLVMMTSLLSVSAISSQVMHLFFLTVWKAASLSLRLCSLALMRSSMHLSLYILLSLYRVLSIRELGSCSNSEKFQLLLLSHSFHCFLEQHKDFLGNSWVCLPFLLSDLLMIFCVSVCIVGDFFNNIYVSLNWYSQHLCTFPLCFNESMTCF